MNLNRAVAGARARRHGLVQVHPDPTPLVDLESLDDERGVVPLQRGLRDAR